MNQELHICHLYPDFLNLYGDFGNILALTYRAKQRGITVHYHKISLGDVFDQTKYDLFFIGGGQDQEQGMLREDLIEEKREQIVAAVEANKPFLCICGGYQLFGRYFHTKSGEKWEGLGILPVHTIGKTKRLIGDVVCSAKWLAEGEAQYLHGFENHSGYTYLDKGAMPMAEVILGSGNDDQSKQEGCRYKNVFGTYLHGSFLPKNPAMTDYLLQLTLQQKYGEDVVLAPLDTSLENYTRRKERNRLNLHLQI